jgi:hypothetical protein
MKNIIFAAMTLCFCISANAACNTKSLKGEYGFGVMSGGSQSTCAAVGTVLFKNGVAVATAMQGCGGNAGFTSLKGTYTLGQYCVGEIDFDDGSTAHFVLDKSLKIGQFFMSQNNVITYGSIFRQ